MYVVAMSKVMIRFRQNMRSKALISSFALDGCIEPSEMNEVGYIDDTAIPVFSKPAELVNRAKDVAICAADVFYKFHMTLNFNSGKSECLPLWYGKGSVISKRKLADMNCAVQCAAVGTSFELRFVAKYKHIGTFIDACGCIRSEISVKCAVILCASSSLELSVRSV